MEPNNSEKNKNINNIINNKTSINTTFQKIIKLQEGLKIKSSIKKQFEGNRRKMINRIYQECHNYFKDKISMKKIFDYCSNNIPEKIYDYILLSDKQTKEIIGDNYYNILSNFFFVLRNDNNLMLKIIENTENEDFDDMSDFLVNFCYEDIINCSFIQEELLILIYLLLEKYIINIDTDIKSDELDKNNNLYEEHYSFCIKNNILNKIFISLTRKVDIRNYLCNILSGIITNIGDILNILSVDIGKIHQIIKTNKEKKNSDSSSILNRIHTFKNSEISNCLKRLSIYSKKNDFKKNSLIFGHRSSVGSLPYNIDIFEENRENNYIDENLNISHNDIIERNSNINLNVDLNIIDPFFLETDTTLEYLENKLKEYENYPNENLDELNINIIDAMKEYLNFQINEIKKEEGRLEKYSNFVLINSLNSQKTLLKENDDFKFLMDYIKSSYENIVELITNFISIIKLNINSIPFFIKSISNMIEILLNYKFQEQNKISLLKKFMLKANFFFGNIIIPILENPFYNGVITTDIISEEALQNCELISSIFKLILSGNLFYLGNKPCMTIFNKFIIEILPDIFQIVQNLEINFKLPEIITNLFDSIKDMNKISRKINYDYFCENSDEKFKIQSICFSYTNALNILKSLEKNKNNIFLGVESDENNKKEIIELMIKNINYFKTIFQNKLSKEKKEYKEYINISILEYLPSFEEKINSILKDNFISLDPPKKEKIKEEEISRFKRCLSEVLTYANLIHLEDIPTFTEIKNNKYIYDINIIELLLKKLEKKRYDKIMEINGKEKIESDYNSNLLNPDFKNEIFPKIMVKIKEEIGENEFDEYLERILYCCSYIQLHINLLPEKYCLDNYKLLFIELIKDTEDNVHILRNNILNQLNVKIKGSLKTNMIISSIFNQIKTMEKLKCIEYLYNKISFPFKFNINYSFKKVIKSINFIEDCENSPLNKIKEFIPDFSKLKDIEDILDFEEKVGMSETLDIFFTKLKKLLKTENILKKYSSEEIQNICCDFADFIQGILYDKIFPIKKSKSDIKFYKKCLRLQFIKPENIIQDKNIINENLCEECYKYIKEIDNKKTPGEKIKCFAKAFSILQNSIIFSSGKKDLGVDDTLKPLLYIIIKAKPEKIFSNYNYCRIYLDKGLSKKHYGALLTQLCLSINIIDEMKYNELIDVTEEQFGIDEE